MTEARMTNVEAPGGTSSVSSVIDFQQMRDVAAGWAPSRPFILACGRRGGRPSEL